MLAKKTCHLIWTMCIMVSGTQNKKVKLMISVIQFMIIILKHECIYIFSVLIYRLVYNHIYACNPLSDTCDGACQCQYATIICIRCR